MANRLAGISPWLALAFPLCFIGTFAGVFNMDYLNLAILSAIGTLCCFMPLILKKIGISAGKLKYISIIAIQLAVMLLGTDSSIGIYMTFGLAMVMSLMYFDPKFTRNIAIINYPIILISLWFRSQTVTLDPPVHTTPLSWWISFSLGFMIEQSLMFPACYYIAKLARGMLEKLHDTEKVAEVMDKCGAVSGEHGKGFAVVADGVRSLAEESQKSSDNISSMIEQTLTMLESVRNANEKNTASVESGIESNDSIEIGNTVRQMASDMTELVENSKSRAAGIIDESEEQTKITHLTEDTFKRVEGIANELLEISTSL